MISKVLSRNLVTKFSDRQYSLREKSSRQLTPFKFSYSGAEKNVKGNDADKKSNGLAF